MKQIQLKEKELEIMSLREALEANQQNVEIEVATKFKQYSERIKKESMLNL